MSFSRFILVAGAVATSLLVACQQRREPVDERTPFVLTNESEWSYSTHPALPLSATDLREISARSLQNSGRFVAASDEASHSPLTARAFAEILAAEITPGPANTVAVDVRVRFQLVPPLSDDPSGLVAVAAGTANGQPSEAIRSALLNAMGRALEQIAAEQHGQTLSDAQLVLDLASNDTTKVDVALSRLSARRHAAAFAPLVARLHNPDVDAAQQAVAYLVSLNDLRAVRPIIEEAEQRGLAFRIEALYALGSLGGDEAEGYLFALTSDSDVRIRTVATEALNLAHRRTVSRMPTARAPEPTH